MATGCPHCACVLAEGAGAHVLLAMLAADDLDAALAHGLLDARPCAACATACTARLLAARDARRVALAARERHRARGARLARRKAERDAARVPPPSTATMQTPALPSAAAEALARALAKAAARKP
jgi:Na+-translocating ferredoxin:NAD+ oxidoreductase RnfC subunit